MGKNYSKHSGNSSSSKQNKNTSMDEILDNLGKEIDAIRERHEEIYFGVKILELIYDENIKGHSTIEDIDECLGKVLKALYTKHEKRMKRQSGEEVTLVTFHLPYLLYCGQYFVFLKDTVKKLKRKLTYEEKSEYIDSFDKTRELNPDEADYLGLYRRENPVRIKNKSTSIVQMFEAVEVEEKTDSDFSEIVMVEDFANLIRRIELDKNAKIIHEYTVTKDAVGDKTHHIVLPLIIKTGYCEEVYLLRDIGTEVYPVTNMTFNFHMMLENLIKINVDQYGAEGLLDIVLESGELYNENQWREQREQLQREQQL